MDQGRFLPTPEQVTFRLTRDVVAGLGACGVEGAFTRCAEATMRVMRATEPALLAVLSVLLHDPLYRWAVGPDRARRIERRRAGAAPDASPDDGGGPTATTAAAAAALRDPSVA